LHVAPLLFLACCDGLSTSACGGASLVVFRFRLSLSFLCWLLLLCWLRSSLFRIPSDATRFYYSQFSTWYWRSGSGRNVPVPVPVSMLVPITLLFLAAVACMPIEAAFVSAPLALRSYKSPTKCGLIRMSDSGTAVSGGIEKSRKMAKDTDVAFCGIRTWKTILRVPWTPSADGHEAAFAYAKNLYTKEETAAEVMWEDR